MSLDKIIKDAADLKRKNDFLSHKRALELAKKFHKEEKDPQDGNPIGAQKNIN